VWRHSLRTSLFMPLGPKDVRVISESFLHASMLRMMASCTKAKWRLSCVWLLTLIPQTLHGTGSVSTHLNTAVMLEAFLQQPRDAGAAHAKSHLAGHDDWGGGCLLDNKR